MINRVFGKWSNGDSALVFEDNVVAAEGPAVIAGSEMVMHGENAPYQRIINAEGRHM